MRNKSGMRLKGMSDLEVNYGRLVIFYSSDRGTGQSKPEVFTRLMSAPWRQAYIVNNEMSRLTVIEYRHGELFRRQIYGQQAYFRGPWHL